MKVKLGQKIVFKADHHIELEKGGTVLVKKGDIAKVARKIDATTGEILYITGEATGKSQYMTMEVDDNIDTDAIAKMIMNGLK